MKADAFFNTVRDALHKDFLCQQQGSFLEHVEVHHDNSTSKFRLKCGAKMVAFSLDKKAKNPFPILNAGFNKRNDLTLICLTSDGKPLVFVIECKNSERPGDAQIQIEAGIAFCEYLFKILLFTHGLKLVPRFFGVAVFRPRQPPKGQTRPTFVRQGNHNILRAEWHVDVDLPVSELIRAVEN